MYIKDYLPTIRLNLKFVRDYPLNTKRDVADNAAHLKVLLHAFEDMPEIVSIVVQFVREGAINTWSNDYYPNEELEAICQQYSKSHFWYEAPKCT
jgi:hypothetical protein